MLGLNQKLGKRVSVILRGHKKNPAHLCWVLFLQPQQTPVAVAQEAVVVGKGVVVDIFPG